MSTGAPPRSRIAFIGRIGEINTCLLGTTHKGIAHSEGWAVVMGLLLVLLAAIAALRWRRRLMLILAAFLIAYGGGLVALYEASHLIWGDFYCTY